MFGKRWCVIGPAVVAATLSISQFEVSFAAEPSRTEREFVEMQTSINATMVAVVDWAAHEIWEAGYAETMTGRNWLTTKQYAIQLLASGTLVSLGGNGKADMGWVNNPEWQTWSAKMIHETERALVAIDAKDQAALKASGERLVDTCEGCHDAFKPNIPTEGILHVPHHEYGEPLITE
ncbi:MAG: cytochrome c [Woeseiaceae bacterium]